MCLNNRVPGDNCNLSLCEHYREYLHQPKWRKSMIVWPLDVRKRQSRHKLHEAAAAVTWHFILH